MALTDYFFFFSISFCHQFRVCIEIENNAIQTFIVLVWTWLFVSSVTCRKCNLMYRLFLMSLTSAVNTVFLWPVKPLEAAFI